MTTEGKFKFALKDMMLTKPLQEITVTALCSKCRCHRQTFYYHYQDIYDLLASIFLNESIPAMDNATDIKGLLLGLLEYSKANFAFLKSSYGSAARDLVDDFFYGRIMAPMLQILLKDQNSGLTKDGCRVVARRFSKLVSDEFGYAFKDARVTVAKFDRQMKKYINAVLSTILPSLVELTKIEKKR